MDPQSGAAQISPGFLSNQPTSGTPSYTNTYPPPPVSIASSAWSPASINRERHDIQIHEVENGYQIIKNSGYRDKKYVAKTISEVLETIKQILDEQAQ